MLAKLEYSSPPDEVCCWQGRRGGAAGRGAAAECHREDVAGLGAAAELLTGWGAVAKLLAGGAAVAKRQAGNAAVAKRLLAGAR